MRNSAKTIAERSPPVRCVKRTRCTPGFRVQACLLWFFLPPCCAPISSVFRGFGGQMRRTHWAVSQRNTVCL